MQDIEILLKELYNLRASHIKFGLETEQALLQKLGSPHRNQKFVHIAGTNGKGSVSAMVEIIFRYTGQKTALYTSPHLIKLNERIRVNGRSINDEQLIQLIELVSKADKELSVDNNYRKATFFEFITAVALKHFENEKVDVTILETGMGGRLDATNVVTPLISVITGISYDHTEFLGKKISDIAREKAGIIKPKVPVVVGKITEDALSIIREIAEKHNATLIESSKLVSVQKKRVSEEGQLVKVATNFNDYPAFTLPLLGDHQLVNLATALVAAETVADIMGIELEPKKVARAIGRTFWPARFQILKKEPLVILDGAHNPEGASVLVSTLEQLYPKKNIGLIIGMCSDKDIEGFLKAFKMSSLKILQCWPVQLKTERACEQEKLAQYVKQNMKCDVETFSSLSETINFAEKWAKSREDAIIVICGSLYLAGEVLSIFQYEDLFG